MLVRLVLGVVLFATFIGCTGPLVYRPEKKVNPEVMIGTDSDKKTFLPEPDPKLNNSTVAGIDTTGVGVRDDVHIWVFSSYTSVQKRNVVMGMAKKLQTILVQPAKTVEEARNQDQAYRDALLALKGFPGLKPGEAGEIDNNLYLQTMNTPERLKEYLRYNFLREGIVPPETAKAPQPGKAPLALKAPEAGKAPEVGQVPVLGEAPVGRVPEAGKAPVAETPEPKEIEIDIPPF